MRGLYILQDSTIIAGNGSAGKFILQKGAAAISMNFTNSVGTDEVIIDASGRFGVGKTPSRQMDVSGDANFDGDITVVTTNPTLNTGGKISARELVLTDPSTGATTTLNAISGGGGLSRGKVFTSYLINKRHGDQTEWSSSNIYSDSIILHEQNNTNPLGQISATAWMMEYSSCCYVDEW